MDIGLGDDRKVGKGGSLSVDECQGQRLWRRRNEQRVSTIHQDTIKFSSSAVQIHAIIERFFLEPSVFILLDSTLDREFFLSLESGSASLSYRGEKLRRRISRLVYQRDVGPTPEEEVRRRTTQSKVR